MGRFNLIDEPWISVVVDEMGQTEEISLKSLFENAHIYKCIAGDTKAQDFAVLRVLLAILHTVFSRFDAHGEPYIFFDLDEQYKPTSSIEDEEDLEDYTDALYQTWKDLWLAGQFPEIINEYLEKWRDHFNLLDEEYPFFQVTKNDLYSRNITVLGKQNRPPTKIEAKKINGLITESNKVVLFSPKYNDGKNIITEAELSRWLITYQGYSNTSDKADFTENKNEKSFGWLYSLGGLFFEGRNLFETLLLNTILVYPDDETIKKQQRPCWEFSGKEIIDNSIKGRQPDNLSELYTNWGRAIYVDPEFDGKSPLTTIEVVKLSKIDVRQKFAEPMTIWKFNESGPNKDTFTPRKHQVNQSIWRSFGLLSLPSSYVSQQRQPGIIDWMNDIASLIGDYDLTLCAISMKDDGNATSWVPVDEATDQLSINDLILTDIKESGWVPRISDAVEETKEIIKSTYRRRFLMEIKKIRNIDSKSFVDEEVEKLYFQINAPFSRWLSELRPSDSKDNRIFEWSKTLKTIVLRQAEQFVKNAGPRDYTGIVDEGKTKNIATIYNSFIYSLNQQLK